MTAGDLFDHPVSPDLGGVVEEPLVGRLVWQWADGGSSMEDVGTLPQVGTHRHLGTVPMYLLCSLAGSSRREAKLQWRVS